MSPLESILLQIPTISLLLYVPVVCYSDLKWREIPHLWWLPLWAVNVPVMVWLYSIGLYPIYALPISLIMAAIFWAMHRFDYIQGADTLWLWAISLFFVLNPVPFLHGPEQFIFYLYLMAMMILTAPVLFFMNLARGFRGSLKEMMGEWPLGVPLALPISAALLLTVVLG
jgi:hypothetical protein